MKNRYIKYLIILISIILISCICLMIPIMRSTGFWISYIFYILHTILLIFISNIVWKKKNELKNTFLNLPIFRQELVIYILQIILLFVTLFVINMPIWVSTIFNIVIFGIALIKILLIVMGRNSIISTENKIKEKTYFIKSIQIELEMIAEKEENYETKEKIEELSEKIKYSDPMSNEKLAEIEKSILEKTQQLKESQNKLSLINEIDMLVIERNKKCKILK